MNHSLMAFINQLGKGAETATPGAKGAKANRGHHSTSLTSGSVLEKIKDEPMSEEDLKALQKDRQKKDNHNMSEWK